MSAQRPTVLFVCTGNTCRSPYAAAVARHHGLDASSAGLAVGAPGATAEAILAARTRGVDLSDHATRPLTDELRASADIVVGLSADHARALGPGTRVLGGGIDDPYGKGAGAYELAYGQIERAVAALAEELR